MFDMLYETEVLQDRLMNVLALDCLDSEELANARTDIGYINCAIDYAIVLRQAMYDDLLESIEAYEELSC